jgi:hypothetical protein
VRADVELALGFDESEQSLASSAWLLDREAIQQRRAARRSLLLRNRSEHVAAAGRRTGPEARIRSEAIGVERSGRRCPACGLRRSGGHRAPAAGGSWFARAPHELGDRSRHKLRVVDHRDVAEP